MSSRLRPWWRKQRSIEDQVLIVKDPAVKDQGRELVVKDEDRALEAVLSENGRGRVTTHHEMHELYRGIQYQLRSPGAKVIQFVGVKGGEGVSTVVREFAATAAYLHDKKVLILDAAHHNPSQHVHFSIDSSYGWIDAFRNKEPVLKACYRLDEYPCLFLSPISSQPSLSPWCSDEADSALFFHELKESFDLILVDSAPVLVSADSLTTCRFCDGVVLVIEAGRNWRIAETARKKISDNGGSIIGAVFNKRKLYIPELIYKILY